MLTAFLVAIIIYFSIQLIEKDKEAVEFSNAFLIAFAPVLVMFIVNFCIKFMGISEVFSLLAFVIGVVLVFVMAKSFFSWSSGKAALLAVIYLISKLAIEFGFVFLFT